MAGRRSSLAALERALRVVEPGANNLGQYLATYGEDLARRLGVHAEELQALVALPDAQVAPCLEAMLQRRAEGCAARHEAAVREVAIAAAQQLASTVVWKNQAAVLDVSVLLGDLLLDTNRTFIALHAFEAFQVNLPRSLLVEVAKVLLPSHPDLVAWVEERGLHLRWRRGRGGLNLISQEVPARESATVLYVNLPPAVIEAPQPLPVVSVLRPEPTPPAPAPKLTPLATRAVAAAPRRGGWFAEILAEVALS